MTMAFDALCGQLASLFHQDVPLIIDQGPQHIESYLFHPITASRVDLYCAPTTTLMLAFLGTWCASRAKHGRVVLVCPNIETRQRLQHNVKEQGQHHGFNICTTTSHTQGLTWMWLEDWLAQDAHWDAVIWLNPTPTDLGDTKVHTLIDHIIASPPDALLMLSDGPMAPELIALPLTPCDESSESGDPAHLERPPKPHG